MHNATFITNSRGLEGVTILAAQEPAQFIKPFYLCIQGFLELIQFYHLIIALLESSKVHFSVMTPTKGDSHYLVMLVYILESHLIQFCLQAKPIMPTH